jgi:hypothetical protein
VLYASGRGEWTMKEGYTDPEHPEEGETEDVHAMTKKNILRYFQSLKVKYTKPGNDRPDLRYYLIVACWAVLVCWWVFSFFIQMDKGQGNFLEGKTGFVLMLIERTGYITVGIAGLNWWRKSSSKKFNWPLWLTAVCLVGVSYLGLRNPIRDIPYLSHPAEVVLQNWKTETDTGYEYSTYYEIWGTDESGQRKYFYINKTTIDNPELSDREKDVKVEYLPYTETVMSLTAQ